MKAKIAIVALAGLSCLGSAQSWQFGDPAPEFSLMSTEGKRLFLRDLQNNGPIVLYFIRYGDAVNNQAAPWIHRIIKTYVPGRAKWYGVITEKRDRADSWQAEFNPPYRLLLDPEYQAVRAFKIESSPAIVLIGADGKIVKEWQGYSGYWLKDLNHYMARVNDSKFKYIDFNSTPSTTRYGAEFIVGAKHP
ncbi:MAG TPA: redoxin domain-containing protein [Fimbriimonas sp.]